MGKNVNLTKFEKSVCIVYAKYHHFSLPEIENLYKRLRSFDNLLLALQMADIHNISLMDAADKIEELKPLGE